ncbi:hypothetical protein ACFYSF_32505 [Streptomyces canus]|uniref:hypothetical protein n=1 Tax=Streptomyces canus TaxID=58343 RepID=UPI0036B85181
MAEVWILRRRPKTREREALSRLVRADIIRNLLATERQVTTSELGADEAFTLAMSARDESPLPLDFHLELLAEIASARRAAKDSEDQVVIAERDEEGASEWAWKTYTLSELT